MTSGWSAVLEDKFKAIQAAHAREGAEVDRVVRVRADCFAEAGEVSDGRGERKDGLALDRQENVK